MTGSSSTPTGAAKARTHRSGSSPGWWLSATPMPVAEAEVADAEVANARASRLLRAISGRSGVAGWRAATPTFWFSALRAAWSGDRASTVSGLSSSRPSHSGPLLSDWAASTCAGCRPSAASTRARWVASGVLRVSGGAAKAMRTAEAVVPPARGRSATTPTAHSWRTSMISPAGPVAWGWPPWASQAWQVPRVGWPAKGSSQPGVKMRTR